MLVHSLLLSDSLTLHRHPPSQSPSDEAICICLHLVSFRKSNICGCHTAKKNLAAGRTNKEKDKRWQHLLRNKEHLHKCSTAILLFIEQHCELWQCFILSKTLCEHCGNHNSKSKQNPVRRAGGQVDAELTHCLSPLWTALVSGAHLLSLVFYGSALVEALNKRRDFRAVPPRLDYSLCSIHSFWQKWP